MGYDPNVFEDEEAPLSLKESLSFFKETAGDYFAARSELLSLEAKEAGEVMRRKLSLLIVLALAGCFGYVLFWTLVIGVGSVLLSGKLGALSELHIEWMVMAAIVLILHIVVVLVVLMNLKEKRAPLFSMSKAELRKDKQWLEEEK